MYTPNIKWNMDDTGTQDFLIKTMKGTGNTNSIYRNSLSSVKRLSLKKTQQEFICIYLA